MGVPVLTVAGRSMVSRQAAAVLAAAGQPSWICDSTEALVQRCQELLAQPEELAALRQGLRPAIAKSELLDHAGLAQALSEGFRQWWQRWVGQHYAPPSTSGALPPWPVVRPPAPVALGCPYPR
jgi:predicted O-linked N-acetylglucosamine transferase (SPINDLY family)